MRQRTGLKLSETRPEFRSKAREEVESHQFLDLRFLGRPRLLVDSESPGKKDEHPKLYLTHHRPKKK